MAESNDTPLDLDAIEARCDAATPGPWVTTRPEPLRDGPATGFSPGVLIAATSPSRENRIYAVPPGGQYPSADQRFIAHAREDVPALTREVRRLRALLRSLGSAASDYVDATPSDDIVGNDAWRLNVDVLRATLTGYANDAIAAAGDTDA